MEHYKFYQNQACEYFPCHGGISEENFNCLFCYCPLYVLGDRCGGHFSYMENGMKDCSGCTRPHIRQTYDEIISQIEEVMELGKRMPCRNCPYGGI